MIISNYNINYSFSDSVKAWLMGFSISMITPARVGDFSRAYHLRNITSIGKALTTVVVDRIIDIFILFILATIGILNFITFYTDYLNLLSTFLIFFFLFILAVYIFTKKEIIRNILRPLFNRFVPEKYKARINFTFNDFYEGLSKIKRRKMFLPIILGIIGWLFSVLQFYIIALSLNLEISYMFLLSVMPIIILLDTLPISFSGIGTRDAALVFFMSFIYLGSEYAISLSVLIFLLGYIVPGLIGSVLIWRAKINLDMFSKEANNKETKEVKV
jgi:uncharacterized protein (TIRG00374 family)